MAQPARTHARTLASILLEANVVQQDQVGEALVRQRSTGLRIGETLVEMGAATEEDIGWALARQLDLPFVDPRPEALDCDLIRSFPEGLLLRLDAVPLVREEATLSVALADPTDTDIVKELERAAGVSLTLAVATPSAIRKVLREILGIRRNPRSVVRGPRPDGRFDVKWDRSGEGFLLFHLRKAVEAGVNEVHFLARRGSLEVHHRLGNRLVQAGSDPPRALTYLLTRIEALGGPVLTDRSAHVVGRVACPNGTETMDLGVSLLPLEEGISVTLTWGSAAAFLPQLEDIGLDDADLKSLREAFRRPGGLGIVTGPPRAGGSTTLACLLAGTGTADRRCLAFGPSLALVPAPFRVSLSPSEATKMWPEIVAAQCADIVVLDGVLEGAAIAEALSPKAAGRCLLVRSDWTDTFALLEYLAARDRAAVSERLSFVIQQRLLQPEEGPASTNGSHPPGRPVAAFEVLVPTGPLRAALRAGDTAVQLRRCAEAEGMRPLSTILQDLAASGRVSAAEAGRLVA